MTGIRGTNKDDYCSANMTHNNKIVLLFLSLSLMSSCSPPRGDKMDSCHYVPLRTTEEVTDLTPFVSNLDLIKVGAGDDGLPGISKILFSEPLVLLSGGVVYSASSDFKDITRVGNVGRGPGEYLSIKDIAINSLGDEIWCMDVLNSVLRYDLMSLGYLGRIDFQKNAREYARAMIPQKNNSVALYTPNPDGNIPQGNKTFYCISIFNSSGREVDQKLSWTQYNVMAGFSNPVSVVGQGKYVLSPESSNVAYVFDDEGVNQLIVFDFGSKWIPSNYLNPRNGDPIKKIGDIFEMDCFKLISSIYFPGDNLYFHAYGKDSSSWNFYLSKDGSHGIRWRSIGSSSPPISAIASEGEYLYFPYEDYGLVEKEEDPLKQYVIQTLGSPENKGSSYLIKIKLNVD